MTHTTQTKCSSPDGQTRLLARFVSQLQYEQLPSKVIDLAKTCLLDTLGSAFLGSTMPWGKICTEYVRLVDNKPEAVVVGSQVRVAAANAALANGTMAHGFEVDDVFIPAVHHPGVVVIPAALAVAEREGSTGRELLTAIVAGYELMNRVGRAVGAESHLERGFFPTGTNGPFGAVASAAKLQRLNEDQLTDALGIAGSQSAGVFEGIKEGRMTKRFGAGKAAQSGIIAADLARLGFTGPTTILEGEFGYLKAFTDRPDRSALTERLGESYNILETSFKPYPCCKALHACIDAVLELKNNYRIDLGQVEEVVVGGYEKLVTMHNIYEPATSMAAQFSIPYVVSVALLRGAPGLESFEEQSFSDRRSLDFARKVKIALDPEIIALFPANEAAKVTVKTRDGRSYSKTVVHSKGTPENPMTKKELEAKFKRFASMVIPEKQAEEVAELIWNLDRLNNVSGLCSLLRKNG